MKKISLLLTLAFVACISISAQNALPKVYNENINPLEQIDNTIVKAKKSKKNIARMLTVLSQLSQDKK